MCRTPDLTVLATAFKATLAMPNVKGTATIRTLSDTTWPR